MENINPKKPNIKEAIKTRAVYPNNLNIHFSGMNVSFIKFIIGTSYYIINNYQ